jgi:hypothetical protein
MAWPSLLVCRCLTTANLRKFRARAPVSSKSLCLRIRVLSYNARLLLCYLLGPTASLSLFNGLAPVIR